jgi:hypothetical protein
MAFNNQLLKVLGNGAGEQVPGFNGGQQRPMGGFDRALGARNAALAGTQKYLSNTPFYGGIDAASGVKGYQNLYNSAGRDEFGGLAAGNAVGPYRQGDYMFSQMDAGPGGRYYAVNTKDPSYGTGQTKGDVYDASGKYLGSQYFDTEKSAMGKLWDKAIPLGAAAFIGGGIAGGMGYGPFAGSGTPATGTLGAGAGEVAGLSGATAGDAGLMYAGADAAAAGGLGGGASLGGVGTAAAGAGAATAGSSGGGLLGGLGSIIKGGGGAMSFDWGDVIGLGKDLIGGYMNSRAADKATDAQVAATERAIALSEPWRRAGATSLNKLQDVLGFNGAGKAQSSLMLDPSYKFRVDEGAKQLERRAASRGRLLSGATDKALVRYGQDMASQEYTNSVNRLLALAGLGQTSAATNANFATQAGNAQAAGTVAGTNAWTSGLNNAFETWQTNELMNQLLRR